MPTRHLWLGLTALIFSSVAYAQPNGGDTLTPLAPGAEHIGALSRANQEVFALTVEDGASWIELKLEAREDADLYVCPGAPCTENPAITARWASAVTGSTETLYIPVGSAASETLYASVVRSPGAKGSVEYQLLYSSFSDPDYTPPPVKPDLITRAGLDGILRDGMSFPVVFDDDRNYRTFVFSVPGNAKSFTVTAVGQQEDIDLFLRRGAPMDNYNSDPDFSSAGSLPSEYAHASRRPERGGLKLKKGIWYLDVANPNGNPTTVQLSVALDADEPTDFFAAQLSRMATPLSFGEPVSGEINREQRSYQSYRVEVPEGTQKLSIQTLDATLDVDLFAKYGSPINDYDSDYDAKSMTGRVSEALVLDGDGDDLKPGTYFIDVVSFISSDEEVQYNLVVNRNEQTTAALTPIQPPAPPLETMSPLDNALFATVKLDGAAGSGSGTLIAPEGFILTNHHVIAEDDSDDVVDFVYVSMSKQFDSPPEQMFEATVLEYDEDLDLALLQIVKDLNGNDLTDQRFPTVALTEGAPLRIASDVMVAGYPMVGGSSSRSSISVTRGILSGFTQGLGDSKWLKTDARINAGNSGGALLSNEGVLLGVPTKEIIQGDDELGYCRPITEIPEAWWTSLVEAGGTHPLPEPSTDCECEEGDDDCAAALEDSDVDCSTDPEE